MLSGRCSSVNVSTNHAARPFCSTASLRRPDIRIAASRVVNCHSSHDGVSVLSSEHDNVEEGPSQGAEDSSKKAHAELLTQLIDSCASLQDVEAFIDQHGQELSSFAAARLALKVEGLLAAYKHAPPAMQFSKVTLVIGGHVPSMGTVGLLHVLSLCATLPKTKRFSKLLDAALVHLTPASVSKSHLYLRHFVHLFLASSGIALQANPQAKGKLQDLANYAAAEVVSALDTASIRDAVLTAKILSSFRHGKKVPSATLRPVLTALAAHTERSLLEYNATQLMITLSCLRVCGGASVSLYKAVARALESGRLGHLTVRHQVTILHVFDSAGQQLPAELRHRLVTGGLADISLLTSPGDVAKLAQATAATPTVSPNESMPIAEYVVRNAAQVPPSVTTTCVAALLSLGCVHEGAIAAFKGAAVPRLDKCRPWQMKEAAFCAAHPSCAEVWPQVRAAAGNKGSGAEISTTTQYLEALLNLTGSLKSWSSSLATGSAQHDQWESQDDESKSVTTAAADARALAQLLNNSAPVDASLRTAAAAACTALAPRAPLGPLAGLVNALRHAGFSRQQDCEVLSHTCVCIEREILLRASPESAASVASILFSLVCMGHVPSSVEAASLARTLRPRFASLRSKAAVQLLWALGRCGHADPSLLRSLLKRMQALQAQIKASSSFAAGSAHYVGHPHRRGHSDELDTLATDVHNFTDDNLQHNEAVDISIESFSESADDVEVVTRRKASDRALEGRQLGDQWLQQDSFDRDAAATFATGIPWALASCGAAHPQGLAASAATRAANLVVLVPDLLEPLPLVHVSSFLWGMAVVRPPAVREAVRRAFQVLVAAVPPTVLDSHLPGAPRPSADSPSSPDPEPTTHTTHRSKSHSKSQKTVTVDEHTGLSAAGERLFGSKPVELSALEPLDWVNVLYASARFKFRNTWLLRKALMELTANSCAAIPTLSVSRISDLADALGNLRLYSVTLTAALTQRFISALTAPSSASKPHVDPHQVATWLFMYASLRHYDAALLDSVSAYAARHQDVRFRSLASLSTALWAHARLGAHPSRFLDLCQLSASELLPVGNPGSPVTIQVQSHVIRIAWALAVLKEWEHPLFRMALNVLSIAQQTTAHSTARTPQTSVASQDNSSLGESAGVDLDFDSEGSESSMAVEAGIEETKDEMQLNKSSSDTADNSERSADELSRSGASFRGATGHDRKMPLRRLPAFSVLQLVQCMLLASAGGKTELLAMLPEGLRVSCGGAWKRAVERQCLEHQDINGAPVPLGLVEGTIASTLNSLGCKFSLNAKTPDGLLRLDCLLHHRLIDGPPGMNFVALDIWKEDQVAQNCRHVLSHGDIRRRIAAARRVHLIPILWQEWRPVISDTSARSAFLQSKLRAAGLQVPFQNISPTDTLDDSS